MLASNLCLIISIVSFHGLQHHRSSYEFLELTNFNATGSKCHSFQNPKDWPIVETQRELQPAATFDRRLRCQPRKLFSESETAILFSGGVPPPPLPVLSRKLFGLRMLEEGKKCEILTRCYAFKMRLFLAGFFLLLSSRSSFKTKEKKNLFLSRWRRSTQFFAHRHKLSPVAAWIIKAWAQAARITELG